MCALSNFACLDLLQCVDPLAVGVEIVHQMHATYDIISRLRNVLWFYTHMT